MKIRPYPQEINDYSPPIPCFPPSPSLQCRVPPSCVNCKAIHHLVSIFFPYHLSHFLPYSLTTLNSLYFPKKCHPVFNMLIHFPFTGMPFSPYFTLYLDCQTSFLPRLLLPGLLAWVRCASSILLYKILYMYFPQSTEFFSCVPPCWNVYFI